MSIWSLILLSTPRLPDLTTRLTKDKNWLNHFRGAYRLVFLFQLRIKTPVKMVLVMASCLKTAYLRANMQINPFIGNALDNNLIQKCSMDLLGAFEALQDKIRSVGFSMVSVEDAADFNSKLATMHRTWVCLSKTKTILPTYKESLKICDCLCIALEDKFSTRGDSSEQKTIKISIDYLTKHVKKNVTSAEFQRFQEHDVQAAYREIYPGIQRNYAWTGTLTMTEFMVYQTLMDPNFSFAQEHEPISISVDTFNRNADVLINLIRKELEQCVHSLDSIIVFTVLLEHGVSRSAATLKQSTDFTFRDEHAALRSGKMSWDGVVRFMDAMVSNMQRVYAESAVMWAKERNAVVCKNPNAITAFIHGLRVLWDIQRMANIYATNVSFKRLQPIRAFQSYRMLSDAFDDRVRRGVAYLVNTREALKEVAVRYPTFKKRILVRSTGSRYVFHGLFVAYVVFRRTKQLEPRHCPETLILEAPRLVELQTKVRMLCDAAIILEASSEAERGAVTSYIQKYTGEQLLPVFMPMSPMSADRAEYALKHKRDPFEKEFAKFLALGAMQLTSTTLPEPLSFLQSKTDEVAHGLRAIIKVNRGVHYKLYGRLIGDLANELRSMEGV